MTRAARDGPTRGSVSSCSAVAVLRSTGADGVAVPPPPGGAARAGRARRGRCRGRLALAGDDELLAVGEDARQVHARGVRPVGEAVRGGQCVDHAAPRREGVEARGDDRADDVHVDGRPRAVGGSARPARLTGRVACGAWVPSPGVPGCVAVRGVAGRAGVRARMRRRARMRDGGSRRGRLAGRLDGGDQDRHHERGADQHDRRPDADAEPDAHPLTGRRMRTVGRGRRRDAAVGLLVVAWRWRWPRVVGGPGRVGLPSVVRPSRPLGGIGSGTGTAEGAHAGTVGGARGRPGPAPGSGDRRHGSALGWSEGGPSPDRPRLHRAIGWPRPQGAGAVVMLTILGARTMRYVFNHVSTMSAAAEVSSKFLASRKSTRQECLQPFSGVALKLLKALAIHALSGASESRTSPAPALKCMTPLRTFFTSVSRSRQTF